MNKSGKTIKIFFAIVVLLAMGIQAYDTIKEKLLYPLISAKLQRYFASKYNAKLTFEEIRGSVLWSVKFENVRIENVKGFPEGLQLRLDLIKLRYNLLDIITRRPQWEIKGLEIIYGKLRLPIKFFQQDRLIIFHLDEKILNLNIIEQLLKQWGGFPGFSPDRNNLTGQKYFSLAGVGTLKGYVILDELKLKSFNVQFESSNVKMFYKDSARADLDFLFNLRNRGDTDFFTGSLMINDGEFACDFFQGLPVIGSGLSRAGNLTVNMAIKAKKVRLINKDADVLLAADLRLKKERRRKTYLTGALDIKSGNYLYRDRRFSLNESRIVFDEKNINDPLLNISGMVKVGRYNINVKIIGSVSSRKVELSSVPYLSESEIKALLLFGKRIDDLSLDEKSELSKDADIAGSLLGNIFLGKAGGELAKFIGIDELLFEPNVSNRGNLEFPSLVLGKNIGNLLYGTYKITSSPVWGASLKQAIGGEVSIFNNLRLRGERYFNESVGIPLEDKLSVEMKVKF